MHFWNLDLNLDILKENSTLTDFVFPIIRTLKTWLDKYLKNLVSEDRLTSNIVNVPKNCWNLYHNTFIIFNDHCHENWVGKKFLLLTCQILGFHVNTLSADDKYSVRNGDKLMIPIQMQLPIKQKIFSEFLTAFLKSRLSFKYFQKKMTLISFVLWKLRTPKTLSDKCLKRPVQRSVAQVKWQTRPSTVEICITASLSDSLIPAKLSQLEKVSLIDMRNLWTAC